MGDRLQISVGDLSELLRPALFALAALASALVLADARRRFTTYAAAAWTLLSLLLPAVALPLYLAARMFRPRAEQNDTTTTSDDTPTSTDEDVGGQAADSPSTFTRARAMWKTATLPLVYLAAVLLVGTLYFYLDYVSFDAHFARARQAKLYNQPERTVRELRAALRRRDDAHTRKLLGMELAEAGRWEEALAEFRAAARGGEPDDRLCFREASALETLGRPAEAADAYRRFLQTELCARSEPAPACADARARLERLRPQPPLGGQ